MASINIHQDLFNFEPKRKGFTSRQIKGFVTGVVVCIALTAAMLYGAGLPVYIAVTPGLCLGMLFAFLGFVPIWGMPAEEAIDRFIHHSKRKGALVWEGPYVEPMKGEVTRAYQKKSKGRGAECSR